VRRRERGASTRRGTDEPCPTQIKMRAEKRTFNCCKDRSYGGRGRLQEGKKKRHCLKKKNGKEKISRKRKGEKRVLSHDRQKGTSSDRGEEIKISDRKKRRESKR